MKAILNMSSKYCYILLLAMGITINVSAQQNQPETIESTDNSDNQYTLLFFDGTSRVVTNLDYNWTDSLLTYNNKQGRSHSDWMFDVFSVTDKNGVVVMLYDSSALSLCQMQNMIQGSVDARLYYKAPPSVMIKSALIGSVSYFGMPVALGLSTFWAPIIPAIHSAVVARHKIKDTEVPVIQGADYGNYHASINDVQVLSDNIKNNDPYYMAGYKRVIAEKRMKSALIGSGIGLVTATVIGSVIGTLRK